MCLCCYCHHCDSVPCDNGVTFLAVSYLLFWVFCLDQPNLSGLLFANVADYYTDSYYVIIMLYELLLVLLYVKF
jgi:hypothetical protein